MGQAARAWALSKDAAGLPRFGAAAMNALLLKFYNKVLGTGG